MSTAKTVCKPKWRVIVEWSAPNGRARVAGLAYVIPKRQLVSPDDHPAKASDSFAVTVYPPKQTPVIDVQINGITYRIPEHRVEMLVVEPVKKETKFA